MSTTCHAANHVPAGMPHSHMRESQLLIAYCEHGDTLARDELITRYLPLVYGVSRRYCQRTEQLEDLVQVGCIGLIKAIDRFDLSRGVALSTYATPNIIGEIKRYFRDKGWAVKVPRGLLELNMRLEQVTGQLAGSNRRSPNLAELADAVSATPEEVMEAIEAGRSRNSLSLDHSLGGSDEGDDRPPIDMIGNLEGGFETTDQRLLLEPGLEKLSPRERTILHLRFFEGLTQSQIAANIGVSQMHVSRLIRRALNKVRTEIELREGKESRIA